MQRVVQQQRALQCAAPASTALLLGALLLALVTVGGAPLPGDVAVAQSLRALDLTPLARIGTLLGSGAVVLVAAGRDRLAAGWALVLVVPLPSMAQQLPGGWVAALVTDLQGLTAVAAVLLLPSSVLGRREQAVAA